MLFAMRLPQTLCALSVISCSLLLAAAPATAEVIYQDAAGFAVQHHVKLNLPPARVYQALSDEVGQWWLADHTYSGNAANLSIASKAGGCFCERWANKEVQHLQVVFVDPPRLLRMTGGLGPLQEEAITGVMDWQLSPLEGEMGTQFQLTYKVSGYRPGGMAGWAAPVDQVLGQQVASLAEYLAAQQTPAAR